MQTIAAIFDDPSRATHAVKSLQIAGVPAKNIHALMPGTKREELEKAEFLHHSTGPGAWGAMGAGIGSFAGAAFVSVLVPGIGPILGIGAIAAAFVAGAFGGSAAGNAIERSGIHDDVGDDRFLFEEALRHEKVAVIVSIDANTDRMAVDSILTASGGQSIDAMREGWWRARRDEEARHFETLHLKGPFDSAEKAYRRGIMFGLDSRYNGRTFEQVAVKLRDYFTDAEEEVFRHGFERAADLTHAQQDEASKVPRTPRAVASHNRHSAPSIP